MDMNLSVAKTPSTVVSEKAKLSIPIYQRLFVWGEVQIDNLLNDLWNVRNSNEHYYLGVITVHENDSHQWEIVDGQQRLTFLTLLGCVLTRKFSDAINWLDFVRWDEQEPRLYFHGRPEDRGDILGFLKGTDANVPFKNPSFVRFVERFECFVDEKHDDDIKQFSKYCFEHAAFLVNELPSAYGPEELNLYFEKMNSTGRQLSPIDVVKGKWFSQFAAQWNACMNFDREVTVVANSGNSMTLSDVINVELNQVEGNDSESVSDTSSKDDKSDNGVERRLIMHDDILALHVLKMMNPKVTIDRNKLIASFDSGSVEGWFDVESFIVKLKEYRKWIDQNIIYLRDNAGMYDYAFRKEGKNIGCSDSDDEEDNESFSDKQMKQFQAMLYASSSDAQEWVLKAYKDSKPNGNGLLSLDVLKRITVENLRCTNECKEIMKCGPEWPETLLKYGSENRRWLALLDYLLWERSFSGRGEQDDIYKQCSDQELKAIRRFVFRRNNRSVEHLHPQTDTNSANQEKWSEEMEMGISIKHHFGNLAMISPGRNSEYSNESVGGKADRVKRCVEGMCIESIKLLLMLKKCDNKDECWVPDKAREHAMEMLKVFQSFLKAYDINRLEL